MYNRIVTHWKTTVQSGLSALIGLSAVAPSISWLTPKQGASLVSLGVVAKVGLGMFQQDAGTTVAVVPGKGEQAVDSHETPDDPSAKVVKQ